MKATCFHAVAVMVVLALAQMPALADTDVGTAFTYQGQLKEAGVPVDDPVNFVFQLWDAETGGTSLGTETLPSTPVFNGLFTVKLDFGVDPWTDNEARWLEIAVDGTPLSPRQELTPTPFSLATRGINVDALGQVGIGTPTPGHPLHVVTSAVAALVAETDLLDGRGVLGWATNALGTNVGVYGRSDGSSGRGVLGKVVNASGTNYGVYGETFSPDGYGVFGLHRPSSGTAAGVRGETNSASPNATGVAGVVTATSPGGYSAGVRGINNGTGGLGIGVWGSQEGSGWGVYGTAPSGRGVYGSATNPTGENYGVYGLSQSDEGYGVYGRNSAVDSEGFIAGSFYDEPGRSRTPVGVYGLTSSAGSYGGYFESTGGGTGVFGASSATFGDGKGVFGFTASPWGYGGYFYCPPGGSGYAGYFDGRVRVGVLEIAGADLAEKFPVSEEVKPGMVVAIDPDHPGQLCLARGAYNRRVAGVVSGANDLATGAILGNLPGNEKAPPIALSGRVWTWCDASNGPIQPGDLLTTSDTPGHAMKVTDYPKAQGAIIGKAMSSLEDERGLVLVLVSLL